MLFLYTWKDKPRGEKVKDIAKMVAFIIIATTAIALIQGLVTHAADNVAGQDS